MAPIPIVLALVGAASAVSGLNSVTAAGGGLQNQLQAVGAAGGELRNLGGEVLALGDEFTEAFIKVDRLSGKMQSLLDSKGVGDAKEQIQELADQLEVVSGEDADAIGLAISKAVATGKTNALRAYGIVLDETAQQAIKAAGDISETAKAQETLNQIMAAGQGAVKTIGDTVSDSSKTLAEFGVRWGNITESMGEGSAEVKAAFTRNILFPLMSIIEASPGLQKTAGGILEIGGYALTAGGGVLQLGSQVAMMTMAFPTLLASGVTTFTAIGTSAMAAGAAVWTAMAPIIPIILAIAAAALVAAAALYVLDKAWHAEEDAQMEANIKAGDATDQARLDNVNKERRKKGQQEINIDQLRAWENDDTEQMDPLAKQTDTDNTASDPSHIQAQIDALKGATTAAPPAAPAQFQAPTFNIPSPNINMPSMAAPSVSAGKDDIEDDENEEEKEDREDKEEERERKDAERQTRQKQTAEKSALSGKAAPSMTAPRASTLETTAGGTGDSFAAQLAALRGGGSLFDSFGKSKSTAEPTEAKSGGPPSPQVASVTLQQGEERTLPNGDILVKVAGEVIVKSPLRQLGAVLP